MRHSNLLNKRDVQMYKKNTVLMNEHSMKQARYLYDILYQNSSKTLIMYMNKKARDRERMLDMLIMISLTSATNK